MPAGHDQCQKRRFQLRLCEIRRRDVSVNMIDRDQRDAVGERQRFGKIDSHQQGADQSRMRRDRNGTDVGQPDTRRAERLLRDAADSLNMRAAGYLRDDAAVQPMHVYLRCHNVRADAAGSAAHLHNCRRGFIT